MPEVWSKSPEEKWSFKKKLFVFKRGQGRFGNKICQYAATLGIANKNDRQAVFDKNMLELKKVFPKVILNIQDPPPKWTILQEKHPLQVDEKFSHLPEMNTTIVGNIDSFRYFENISPWLYTNIFSHFNPILLSNAERFIAEKKSDYQRHHKQSVIKSICVHIRRR